jgi:hypothetical protein
MQNKLLPIAASTSIKILKCRFLYEKLAGRPIILGKCAVVQRYCAMGAAVGRKARTEVAFRIVRDITKKREKFQTRTLLFE